MAWVRSEYAGELAVLSAFVSTLLPWSISLTSGGGITFVVIRFPLFAFQFLFGVTLQGAEVPFLPVTSAPGFPGRSVIRQAYTVWLAAAVVLGLALLLAVAYYAAEERVEAGRVDPVRLMGGLLTLCGLGLAAAAVVLIAEFGGLTVPIGALIVPALGVILLRVERT